MNDAIVLPNEIGDGKEREIRQLFADRWRKLVLIQIRHGSVLADHSARAPLAIQAVAGKGRLNVEGNEYLLTPGTIVPVDAHATHNVQGDPDIAILVTFFRQAESSDEKDTTVRFD